MATLTVNCIMIHLFQAFLCDYSDVITYSVLFDLFSVMLTLLIDSVSLTVCNDGQNLGCRKGLGKYLVLASRGELIF